MNEMLASLVEITTEAAQLIRDVYDTQFTVDYKAPRDPVTQADRRANELICRKLSDRFSGVPIVAEESAPETFAGYQKSERVFFVDPLDGTREFIDRNGQFVVMIGMLEGDRSRVGVVHAPAQKKIWIADTTLGAFELEEGGDPEPIAVSRTARLADARVVASRSHRSEALERVLAVLGARELVALGSAGLKGAEIATGRGEIYVGPGKAGKRWDVCAVDAIVTAAGGRFTDAFGFPFDYRSESLVNDRGIIASNGVLHDAVVDAVHRATSG